MHILIITNCKIELNEYAHCETKHAIKTARNGTVEFEIILHDLQH